MATIDLEDLYKKYEGYYYPVVKVYMGGQDISEFKKFKITPVDFNVEVTSELKASIASFSLLNAYDAGTGSYRTKDLKNYISLGTDVKILMGHSADVMEVFKGYIAGVDFVYSASSASESVIRITALDIKGVMMANNYSKRLKANYYSDAVKEILDESVYQSLKNGGVVDSISIADTPDKPPGGAAAGGGQAPDIRIEMVGESDYDFVVKAAKKFNYEFFSVGGNVVFRKAKLNTQSLGTIEPHVSILSYDIGYNITGVVGEVKVRTMDIGKGSKIEVKKKNQGKVSLGSKAKPLVSSQQYVYIDSSIESQADAENRANYIMEDISYRLGSLKMTLRGIPEFVPGRFITLKGFGDGASNTYYITDVIHEYYGSGSYTTTIEAKASTL
jgi:hypothetical protein